MNSGPLSERMNSGTPRRMNRSESASTKPSVLRLEILQALDLVALQAAELLAPAVIRHLAHPDRTDRLGHALALRGQNINLPQLGDDLFRLVAPSRHHGPPWLNHSSGCTTSPGADHYTTGAVEQIPSLQEFARQAGAIR